MNAQKLIYLIALIISALILGIISLTNQATADTAKISAGLVHHPGPVPVPQPVQADPQMTPIPLQAPTASTSSVEPVPVPTPKIVKTVPASLSGDSVARFIFPAGLILFSLGAMMAWRKRQRTASKPHLLPKRLVNQSTIVLLSLILLGCQPAAPDPLPPDEYLDQALNWMEANAVKAAGVDWEMVRAEAKAIAGQPQTTADTYPAIEYALAQLNDPEAFMQTPEKSVWQGAGLGMTAVYPQNIIVEVTKGSPAAEVGIQVGDEVLAVNGNPPTPHGKYPRQVDFLHDPLAAQSITLTLQRGAEQWEIRVTEDLFTFEMQPTSRVFTVAEKTAAYLELTTDVGTRMFPTEAQAAMATVDSVDTCGWIIDLRRTRGGDLWTYFAALSPILGEGELGGFLYNDGSEELWRFEDGKVFWADEEREESYVRGPLYELKRPTPLVALLIGPLTEAAGELVVVAFQGWGTVRTFGEPTLGAPHLTLHTPLSDGARIFVSGARGMDRSGKVYNGSIMPDEPVAIDWQHLGDSDDPVLSAALDWLATQPTCIP